MSSTLEQLEKRFPAHIVELACRRQGLDRTLQLIERPAIETFLPPKTPGQSEAARRIIAEVSADSYNETKRKLLAVLEEECLLLEPAVRILSPTSSPKD